MSNILCYLHEDSEPEHWIDARERVGVLRKDDGVVRRDLDPIPAAHLCAVHNGVDPGRIVEWVAS